MASIDDQKEFPGSQLHEVFQLLHGAGSGKRPVVPNQWTRFKKVGILNKHKHIAIHILQMDTKINLCKSIYVNLPLRSTLHLNHAHNIGIQFQFMFLVTSGP